MAAGDVNERLDQDPDRDPIIPGTRWAFRHPAPWSLIIGLVMAFWISYATRSILFGVVVGAGLGLLQWLGYRQWSLFHEPERNRSRRPMMRRRFGKKAKE